MRRVVSVWLKQFPASLPQGSRTGTGSPGSSTRPADEAAALRKLALWCLRYAPLVAPDPPDGLWIDITGCAHLMAGGAVQGFSGDSRWNDSEGEAVLCTDLLTRLERRGFGARVAVADTPGAAHALARYGAVPQVIMPPGEQGIALAGCPWRRCGCPMISWMHCTASALQ